MLSEMICISDRFFVSKTHKHSFQEGLFAGMPPTVRRTASRSDSQLED